MNRNRKKSVIFIIKEGVNETDAVQPDETSIVHKLGGICASLPFQTRSGWGRRVGCGGVSGTRDGGVGVGGVSPIC